jgi:hypothetical protein
MFGVLVVVLSPDHITDLGFRTGKCHILLIGSLREAVFLKSDGSVRLAGACPTAADINELIVAM